MVPVAELDRDLDDRAAGQPRLVRHLDLKPVPAGSNRIKIETRDEVGAVGAEARRGVVNAEVEYGAHVPVAPSGQIPSIPRPAIWKRATGHVAGPDGDVGTGIEWSDQIGKRVRIVLEVGIHLNERVVTVLDPPAKPGPVGGPEARLRPASKHLDSITSQLGSRRDRKVGGSIRAPIVHDKQGCGRHRDADAFDYRRDVLRFVVGGQHHQRPTYRILHVPMIAYSPRMPQFERDGVVLAYEDTGGAGTPMVFLHGLSSARSTWASFVPEFASEHRVLTIDHRGHGESAHAPGTYTLDHYAPDAAAFIEQVVDAPAVLIGHSLGGVIAHSVAWSRPDLVRGVLLEDPPLYVLDRDEGDDTFTVIFTLMRQVTRDMQRRSAPVEEYEAMLASAPNRTGTGTLADLFGEDGTRAQARAMTSLDPEIYTAALDGTGLASAAPATHLSCPTRLLRADPALGAAFSPADEAHFRATNPHAVVTEIEGASHLIHDEQPERYRVEIRALLDDLTQAANSG